MSTKYHKKLDIENDAVLDELLREAFSSKDDAELPLIPERKTAMKKKNKKWVAAAAAAAVCLLIPAGVFASSKATMYTSHSSHLDDIFSFDKAAKVTKDADVEFSPIETFANGYAFNSVNVHETNKLDEDGNNVGTYKEWDADYVNQNGDKVFVDVHRTQEEEADFEAHPQEVREITRANGESVTVNFTVDHYKFVPPDYEKTAEDIENESKPNYYISYGSQEVEDKEFSSVTWTIDGMSMSIMAFDTSMPADEMFAMAEEMIN